jgi:hypothetical protein
MELMGVERGGHFDSRAIEGAAVATQDVELWFEQHG